MLTLTTVGTSVQYYMCIYLPSGRLVVMTTDSLSLGAREAAFRNIKSIAECLADELINAAKVRLTLYQP